MDKVFTEGRQASVLVLPMLQGMHIQLLVHRAEERGTEERRGAGVEGLDSSLSLDDASVSLG